MAQQCQAYCAENGLLPATHHPDSLGLAISDFFLFRYVRHCLQGMMSSSHGELPTAIERTVMDILIETLHAVLNSGWRDWNGFLGAMVTWVHDRNIR
jgi:hypothetical protein